MSSLAKLSVRDLDVRCDLEVPRRRGEPQPGMSARRNGAARDRQGPGTDDVRQERDNVDRPRVEAELRRLSAEAELRRANGDLELARRELAAALVVSEAQGARVFAAHAHATLGKLHLRCDSLDAARDELSRAATMLDEVGFAADSAHARAALAAIPR